MIVGDLIVVGAERVANAEVAHAMNLLTPEFPCVLVDAYGHTCQVGIYAAGDIARLEGESAPMMHENRAVTQGRLVGRNMTGAHDADDSRPFYYSDIYSWGYEAVGCLDTRCEMVEDWASVGEEGVIYYLNQTR